MTYRELEDKVINAIENIYGHREARSIQRFLFRCFSGMDVAHYLLIKQEQTGEEFERNVNQAIYQLIDYVPVQYITGKTWFCDFEFKVKTGVLIPRPETEEMVLRIAEKYNSSGELKILDIGTGSGAIAISLSRLLMNARVSAMDISDTALSIAKENAALNYVNIELYHSDILDKNTWDGFEKYHLLVSNPPYIKLSEKVAMNRNVIDHEPDIALFVEDNDPLKFYKAIAEFAVKHLENDGEIWFEINESESDGITLLLKEIGYKRVELFHDMNAKPRFVTASLSQRNPG